MRSRPVVGRLGIVPGRVVHAGGACVQRLRRRVGDHSTVRTRQRMPGFIEPMAATLVDAPFDDPDWLFEVKWDGFRVEAVVDGDDVRLWTRGQQDAGRYFGAFLDRPTWISA